MKFLIRNTKFAVHKESKEKFEDHTNRLSKIEKNLYRLKSEIKSRGKINIIIDEVLFEKITSELDTLMDDINFNLNKAGLIFTPEEEFNIKDIKKGYKEKFVNRS